MPWEAGHYFPTFSLRVLNAACLFVERLEVEGGRIGWPTVYFFIFLFLFYFLRVGWGSGGVRWKGAWRESAFWCGICGCRSEISVWMMGFW